ncbi:MAG: branched-chain amino acid ABC transporter permease [Deltaproteobacteria bacterium]|nr:branched-chain amino acid ABC transporter permease [Deltaproteobacteria bacterium]
MISAGTIVQSLLSGILEGGNYALYCLGLAFVFGIMRIINMAHGEFVVLGGYAAYWLLVKWGVSPLLSLPLAAGIAGGTALVVYRVLLQRIRTTAELNTLILTFGVGIFLANLFLQLWTADLRNIDVGWAQNPLSFVGICISFGEIAAFALSLAGVLGLDAFLRRTKTGKAIRVTAIDRDAAALAGIDVERIDLLAFGIGGLLAGLAGPLLGMLSYLSPGAGIAVTIKAFILTVLAGVGSIPGLIVAGMILGIGEAMTVTFVTSSYRELFGFTLFLVVLLIRPSGLFGRRT